MVVHTRDTDTLANRLFLSLVIRKGMFVCLSLFSVYLTSLSLLFFVSSLSLFFSFLSFSAVPSLALFFIHLLHFSLFPFFFLSPSTPFPILYFITFTLHISLSFFSILHLHQEFLPWEHGPSEATGYMEQYENSDIALNRILSHIHYLFHVNLNPSKKSFCPIAIDAITLFITRNN